MAEDQQKNDEINPQDSTNPNVSASSATDNSNVSPPDLDILSKLAPEEGITIPPHRQDQPEKPLVQSVKIARLSPRIDPFTKVVEDIINFNENNTFQPKQLVNQDAIQQAQAVPQQSLVAAASSPAEILIAEVLKHEPVAPMPANIPVATPEKKDEALTEAITENLSSTIAQQSQKDKVTPASGLADPTKDTLSQPANTTQTTTQQTSQTHTPISTENESASQIIVQEQPQPIEADTKPTTTETTLKQQHIIFRFFKNPSVLMVLSTLLFSSMVLFVKLASDYYTSFEIISFRGLVGVICILTYQLIAHGLNGIQLLKTAHIGMQAWRAFIGTMSMVFWFYGVSYLTLALSTTLNYMSSIWIAIFVISTAFITGKARPNFKLIFSVLLGFAGIVIILRPSGADINMFAAAIVIIGSFFGALAYLQVAALGRIGEPAYRTVFYFCLFGTFFGLAATFVAQGGFSPFSLIGFAWLVPIGILAMVAQLCLTMAYTGGNPLVNASLQYSGLIFVVLFDWILGYGLPDAIAWLGMSLVVLAGLSATFFQARKSTLSKEMPNSTQAPSK